MAFGKRPKKATPAIELKKPKNMLLPEISLASVESLSVPLVRTLFIFLHVCCFFAGCLGLNLV